MSLADSFWMSFGDIESIGMESPMMGECRFKENLDKNIGTNMII